MKWQAWGFPGVKGEEPGMLRWNPDTLVHSITFGSLWHVRFPKKSGPTEITSIQKSYSLDLYPRLQLKVCVELNESMGWINLVSNLGTIRDNARIVIMVGDSSHGHGWKGVLLSLPNYTQQHKVSLGPLMMRYSEEGTSSGFGNISSILESPRVMLSKIISGSAVSQERQETVIYLLGSTSGPGVRRPEI